MTLRVSMLADHPAAVADLLRSHGWETTLANETAAGVASAAVHVAGISALEIEAMLPVANRLGLQMISGPEWIVLIGPHSRLGAFARPWVQPEPVQALAIALGMAMPPEPAEQWQHATGTLSLETPAVMGILNVTPDSFSVGSRVLAEGDLLRHAEALLAGGATILDVGGESTRPGAQPVSAEEELQRVVPSISALIKHFPSVVISVDTVKSVVARAALEAGAGIINDVTAGRHDPEILKVIGDAKAGVVLSHSRGPLEEIARLPDGADSAAIVSEVVTELAASRESARRVGITDLQVVLDPGLGFGKHCWANLRLIQHLGALVTLGCPVLVGPSRKRFLGEITGREVAQRDEATAAACALAIAAGARLVRVHNPAAVRDAVAMAWATRKAELSEPRGQMV